MIDFSCNSLAIFTPEGVLTLLGTFLHYRQYIIENYRWKQHSTQEGHEARIRSIIYRAIPDHNNIGIDQYPHDFDQIVRDRMSELGKPNGDNFGDETLYQYAYVIRYILETAEVHFLRHPDETANHNSGILLGRSDLPAVRRFLKPDEELAILKIIIPLLPHSGEARLILLQMVSGERENECCGANWSMLKRDPNTGVCKIAMPQTTVVGKNNVKIGGKSENAPRNIIISEFAYNLLIGPKRTLLQQWLASGHTEASFENLPLGCNGSNLEERISTKHMTNFANRIFSQIGIRRDELAALSTELIAIYHEQRNAGLYANINDYRSPTCYLLRRAEATHMVALGYSESDRQYSMGHRIEDPTVDRRLYGVEYKQIELSKKANMRPLLNPVNIKKYNLKPGETISCCNHKEVIIVEPGATSILLMIEAEEPGDHVDITIEQMDSNPQEYELITHQIPIDPDSSSIQYPTEVNVIGYYHQLYAKEIEDFQQWLTKFFREQPQY